ncbi:GNAT family N-acetyltransferase [Sporosarcina cyprini]|uniref:GNAT family N-acetyltransferase n=1 Tax=Sporosarcina cyprini TaxID=2910523 RepID=UPI001EE09689|nr:GNAT family N-acetyltransferase [Sporosarcina cyprini]MCG3087647.1 GNAT family N-acetyltransferase [Sporosarcina cyprini]
MQIETERLLLAACTEESVAEASLAGYDMRLHIYEHLTALREDPSLLGWGAWFVTCKKTGEVIGDIGFKGSPDVKGCVEAGYGIVPTAQGKGFATEAVQAVIQWAFSSPAVKQIIAECHAENLASIRVLEKLQMERAASKNGLLKWQLQRK